MKIQDTKHKCGFTMVELLLYMGVFSILLVILLQVFSGILSSHAESQATSSIDQDGNFILARLAYDIHTASSVTAPALGTSCTWPTVPTCQLTLGSGTTYQVTGGNLTINGTTDPLNSVGTTVTSITFTTVGNSALGSKPSVKVQFTLQSQTIRQGRTLQKQTFQTTVGTR